MIQEIKVSKCCGAKKEVRQVNDFYGVEEVCYNCGKDFVGVSDCADCFPEKWPFKQGRTVPLCEKHFRGVDYTKPSEEQEKIERQVELETPEHLMTVLSVFLSPENYNKDFYRAVNYLKDWLEYRSLYVEELKKSLLK